MWNMVSAGTFLKETSTAVLASKLNLAIASPSCSMSKYDLGT